MRKKFLFTCLVVLFLVMIPLTSRSLFDIGLKVSTLYNGNQEIETDGFFTGMSDGDNWSFGFGLEGRISILHASVLAASVFGDENLMDLYYTAMVDIPIVHDVVYLSLGGGLSNQLDLPQEEDERLRFSNHSVDASFIEVVQDSLIHLQASVDILLGPAVLSVFYLRETGSKIGNPIDQLFTSSGVNKGGVALTLMLF